MLAFYTKLYIKSTHVRLDSKILIQNTLVHIMYRKTPHLNIQMGRKTLFCFYSNYITYSFCQRFSALVFSNRKIHTWMKNPLSLRHFFL